MNKLLTLGVASLATVGVLAAGAATASAQEAAPANGTATHQALRQHNGNGQGNGYQSSLESRAQVLGLSAEQLQAELETKTMSQIALEKGISEEAFRAKMNDAASTRWQARGLSDEEIAERKADREQRQAANSEDCEFGSGNGTQQGGYGRNR
ncbi:hypothetical protein EOL96_00745 [Candidatus Saccharibacteria bacterium]|nr:hypothetical protein [Candidatus Saccharibacteria bacterium]